MVFIEVIFLRLSWAKCQFSLPAGSCLCLILRLDEPRKRGTQHAAQGHLLNPRVQESTVMHFLFYTGWGSGVARIDWVNGEPGVCTEVCVRLLLEWFIKGVRHLDFMSLLFNQVVIITTSISHFKSRSFHHHHQCERMKANRVLFIHKINDLCGT